MADEPAIVFSVKELIGRLDGKLDTITNILTNKADRADVTALEHRISTVEEKVTTIHDQEKARQEREEKAEKIEEKHTTGRRYVVGLVVSIALALLSAAIAIIEMVANHKG